MQEKILVTGGAGYVGSRVANKLIGEGYKVFVADKIDRRKSNTPLAKEIIYRKEDLRIASKAEAAVRGVNYVLHLAANMGPLNYMDKFQADIIQENGAIDASLYQALVKFGIKGIMYSSSSMVFQHAPKFPYKEEDITKINPPQNVYGMSKLLGEYFCRAYREQYGLAYVIIRYHNIYGPGEDSKGSSLEDVHVIPALLNKILILKQYPIEIIGDPNSTRSFVYIDDAVDATVMMLEKMIEGDQGVINNDFNIGVDKHYRIRELAKLIWEIVGEKRKFRYVSVGTTANTAFRREADNTKIRKAIGWKPKWKIEEGIRKTAKWIRENR